MTPFGAPGLAVHEDDADARRLLRHREKSGEKRDKKKTDDSLHVLLPGSRIIKSCPH
jgi:hypothetical protein